MTTGAKIAILVSSVVLIGGGIGVYFYIKQKKEQKNIVSSNATNQKLNILKAQKPTKENRKLPDNIKEISKK
jgi:uncharacterized protein HemX